MGKLIKSIKNIVEENKFYIVEGKEDGTFIVHRKVRGTIIPCSKYCLIGSTVLYKDKDVSYLHNEDVPQKHGQGNTPAIRFIIDSWTTKGTDTVVKYFDEKGYKFIRHIDKDGNLYKKVKKAEKVVSDNTTTI